MHQSVIMCSPAVAVLVVAGRMLWSGEAGEVAHHAALDNAYTAFAYHLFPIGSLLEFPPTRARLLQTRASRQS